MKKKRNKRLECTRLLSSAKITAQMLMPLLGSTQEKNEGTGRRRRKIRERYKKNDGTKEKREQEEENALGEHV